MKTPDEKSPFSLIQEDLREDEWKLIVACIMLNKTSGVQVKNVINEFFERWPDARSLLEADRDEVVETIRPLGLYNRRTSTLFKFSRAFLKKSFESIDELPGVGKYASDSHKMFIEGYLVENVDDKKLMSYLTWARSITEC